MRQSPPSTPMATTPTRPSLASFGLSQHRCQQGFDQQRQQGSNSSSSSSRAPTAEELAADIAFWLPLDLAFVMTDKVIRQARSMEGSARLQAEVYTRRGPGAFVPLSSPHDGGAPSDVDHFCKEEEEEDEVVPSRVFVDHEDQSWIVPAAPETHLSSRYEPRLLSQEEEEEEDDGAKYFKDLTHPLMMSTNSPHSGRRTDPTTATTTIGIKRRNTAPQLTPSSGEYHCCGTETCSTLHQQQSTLILDAAKTKQH